MSGVQAISGGMMAGASAANFSALSASSGLAGSSELGQVLSSNSANSISQMSFAACGSAQRPSRMETLGTLLIALLLSKADNEKEKQNSALLLAELALLGAMGQGAQFSCGGQFSSVAAISEAYSGGGMAAAAGGSFNATA
jgi:hypothetical protein